MKRNKQVVPLIAVIILLSCLIVDGCGKKEETMAPPSPEVAVVTVQSRQVVTTTELTGRTASNLIAEVRPQVGGIIQKRLFTEGADVRAGQPLFQIDPAIYQAAVSNAGAALARSEAQLTTVQLRADRLRELLAEKAVSQQDYDDAAAALKQTQADIQYGKANLETARINLQYTTITAPISGRIGRSGITEGALVTAHQPLALATIQKIDPMYVDVTQSTTDILKLRRKLQEGQLSRNSNQQQVRLILDDGSEYPFKGKLQFQDITVDPTTGSVILRIVFPNPKGLLMPGMFVRAIVEEGVHKNAILVPQQAVSRDPKGNPLTLTVDKEGKVQQKPLTLDRAIGSEWLVSSGLEPGDKVIVEGMLKVKPGIPVKAVPFDTGGKTEQANPPAKTK
ncbi:MAG TPA: efflux RND transporter periplasmic adaptor subunit [Smithella sp.]|jgi:membrane fusion protein (multidrug efflux system)|nr:efflux RND transporter periplasmic adaptor subunit [Smithella sp.]HQN70889.1 efflux RND transporter periplasmic adaptor subunit [Smithella sp.]HQP41555.1 efflux RND transporter periplasmic adaptor subunit [Smithella sp.]